MRMLLKVCGKATKRLPKIKRFTLRILARLPRLDLAFGPCKIRKSKMKVIKIVSEILF